MPPLRAGPGGNAGDVGPKGRGPELRESLRELARQEALAIERDLLGIAEYKPWKRKI